MITRVPIQVKAKTETRLNSYNSANRLLYGRYLMNTLLGMVNAKGIQLKDSTLIFSVRKK